VAAERSRSTGAPFLLPRFPYGVVYLAAADTSIVVVAVAHARRRPRYWLTRILRI
jgi:hypothetical protein